MGRIRLKRKYIFRKHINKSSKIVIIIFMLILMLILSFRYISKSITPILMNYAEIEADKFINAIVNKTVSESKIENVDNLFIINKNNNEINTIDFNVNIVNNMLTKISSKIQNDILLLDSGKLTDIPGYDNDKIKYGIIYEIPSGAILQNNLLSNVGPKIPVKISMRGSIVSNIETKITNYGINNAMINISIKLSIDEQVLLPFTLKKIVVETSIPVAMKLVTGNVPKYYSGGMTESSPLLSFPIEEN